MNAAFDRRHCLRSSLLAAAAATLAGLEQQAVRAQSDVDAFAVVDTHLHCFAGAHDPRFPYHASAPYAPELAATPQHLLDCMAGAGVDHAVVVHPEPYQDDHRYLEHCLDVGNGRLKGTCLFFADRPQSLAQMPVFLQRQQDRVIAARIHAYAPDRLPPFGRPELRQLWKHAADAGVAVQLHFEPRYAPALEPYLKEFTGVTVIIDHLGRPMQGTPSEHAVVVRWARFPNTVMKLAAIPRRDQYPHRDPRPVIRQLTDAWGADRMIYGGGFGADATPESYRRYRDDLGQLLSHLSDTDRGRIFGGTAARLFAFTPA